MTSPTPWIASFFLGLCLVGSLADAQAGRQVDVTQTLVDARRERIATEELAARLAGGGLETIPSLFAILERGRYDIRVGERGNSTRVLSALEREALTAALGLQPWGHVRSFLETLRAEPLEEDRRRAVLELLGAHGTPGDLVSLLSWSQPAQAEMSARIPRARCTAFAAALRGILERRPGAWPAVPRVYESAHLSLVPSITSCVGSFPTAVSLSTLSDLLGVLPEADPLVLAEICHVGGSIPQPIDLDVRDRIRPLLSSEDRTLLLEGILATGRLGDTVAVPRLIELLAHKDRMVCERALHALEEITREHLGSDGAEWAEWYAETMDWWSHRAQKQIRLVRSEIPAQASRAILELSKQRLFRHELAYPLASALLHEDDEIVVLTCATLGHLASPLSVPPLLDCLDAGSVDTRRAALLALQRITGEDHGEDPRNWREAGW